MTDVDEAEDGLTDESFVVETDDAFVEVVDSLPAKGISVHLMLCCRY